VHNSAVVGIRLSGATARSFHHNRLDKLEAILRDERAKYRNCFVVIEGLYSTEGEVPELAHMIEIKESYGAWLMVDDAHGAGVLGPGGGVSPSIAALTRGELISGWARSARLSRRLAATSREMPS
jgi:8-amino-7-oxononanoate synthase